MHVTTLADIPELPWERVNDLLLACGAEREPKALVSTFIRKTASLIGFDSARAFITDGKSVIRDVVSFGVDPKWIARYESFYSVADNGRYSLFKAESEMRRYGTPFSYEGTGPDCMGYDLSKGLGDLDFLYDYLAPQGIRYSVCANLRADSDEHWCSIILERNGLGRFSARDCALFSLLATHAQNMVQDLFAIPRKTWQMADDMHLTPREREVALLMLRGKTPEGISRDLVISRRTVYRHVGSLHKKLGVHNATELVAALRSMERTLE